MAAAFVSKSRRVRFELTLRIVDLNNVPLVSGTSFVKWHLPASTAAEHRGRTPPAAIRDHRVQYHYEKTTGVRLVVGRDARLRACPVELEVLQEMRGERVVLGRVRLDLAEYCAAAPPPHDDVAGAGAGAGATERRYLMQDSKINSTLKLGVAMRHVEGTRDYAAPPLRAAPVFGGIAGIISSSEPVASTPHGVASHDRTAGAAGAGAGASGEDLPSAAAAAMPGFSSATDKEMGEMQDMYRRTLAAFWASQPGELKADECVEDIFAGGDGWGKGGKPSLREMGSPDLEDKGEKQQGEVLHRRNFSRSHHHHHHHSKSRGMRKGPGELDEMDVREDLVGWQIGERAYA